MSNNIARILKIINDKKLVINKGSNDGVKEGEVFLVYNNSEKIVHNSELFSDRLQDFFHLLSCYRE